MSDQLQLPVGTEQKIRQSLAKTNAHELSPSISLLISNISFSHFIELIKCEDALIGTQSSIAIGSEAALVISAYYYALGF